MKSHLNVLVIEDSEDDTMLLIREIKKGGYDPTFVRVETAKDMLACLNDRIWDVVISDYSLPSFSAPQALKVLQETGLDIPFIIVSGKVEDEVAVEALNAGAQDFVRKANMARLVPAIERELNDFIVRKKHEKAETALKDSEKLLATIAQNYPNSYVSIIEEDLTIGFSSGKEFKNQNLDPESFVGLTLDEIFDEKTPIVKKHYLETFDGKETSFEFFFNEQHLKFNTVPLFDKNDEIHRILVVVENATEYKRAEESLMESEEKYSSLFKNNHSVMLLIDSQTGNIVDANSSACDFYGYSKAELIQKNIKEINLLSDEEVQQEMNRAKLEQRSHFFFRHILSSGKIRDVEVYSGPITVKGKSLLYSIIHDITERKQAEKALQKSEQKLIRAQEVGHIGDWENDIVANKLTWSDELFHIYGLEPTDELKFETAVARMHPDDRDYVKETLAGWAKNGEGKPFEYRIVRPDGSIRHVYSPANVIRDSAGEVVKVYGVTLDITERKKADDILRLHSEMLENMGEGVYLIRTSDGTIVYANPRFEEMFGYEIGEMIGQHVSIVNAPTDIDPEETVRALMKILMEEGKWHGDILNIKKDGTPFWCHANVSVYEHSEYGQVLVSVHEDITERKRVEEALLASEEKYRQLIELAQEGIWVIDKDANTTFVNSSMAEMLGYTPDEMSSKHLFFFMDERGVEIATRNLERRQQGVKEQHDFEFLRKDGTHIDTTMATAPITDKAGNYIGAIAGVIDITERKKTENVLKLNNLRMDTSLKLNQMTKASFSEIADFVLETILLVTKSEYGFVGLMNEDESILIAHSWAKEIMDICEVDDKSVEFPIETAGVWGDAVRDRKVIMINDYYDPKTHKTELPEGHVPLSRILTIPTFENDKIVAVATVANKKTNYDDSDVKQITLLMDGMWKLVQRQKAEERLKESAEELTRSNEELKSLDKMKNEFLSNVSHELKTPLISIQGFTEVMQDELYGPLNDKQKHAMDSVFRNSKRLGRLINSILYLTIQKSGRDTYTMHPISLTETINNALNDISPQANNKDLTIENNTQSDLPRIKGDMDKLTQVLINLLENATKFTPIGGKITVAAFEDGENIHITVTDDGIGISAEDISNLFERFYQVDASTTRKYGGTGIGLYISKLIVEVHKGKIWAESEEGAGTTFHVVLPK